jgi:hypothetical protein
MTTNCLPLSLSSTHAISMTLRKTLLQTLPPLSSRQSATSPRKVFVRTGAAIAAGHALEYIHNRQQGLDPTQSYDHADTVVNRCISMLIVQPDSPLLLHCDAAPMTFWYDPSWNTISTNTDATKVPTYFSSLRKSSIFEALVCVDNYLRIHRPNTQKY